MQSLCFPPSLTAATRESETASRSRPRSSSPCVVCHVPLCAIYAIGLGGGGGGGVSNVVVSVSGDEIWRRDKIALT